jgi:hypothetical protein
MIQSINKSIGGIMNPITEEKTEPIVRISQDEARVNVALLLLYLSGSYRESKSNPGEDVFRASKNVLLKDLNRLYYDGMLEFNTGSRSVFLTQQGRDKGFDLLVQYCRKFNLDIYDL